MLIHVHTPTGARAEFDEETLRAMWAGKMVADGCHYWMEGMDEWRPLEEFFAPVEAVTMAQPSPPPFHSLQPVVPMPTDTPAVGAPAPAGAPDRTAEIPGRVLTWLFGIGVAAVLMILLFNAAKPSYLKWQAERDYRKLLETVAARNRQAPIMLDYGFRLDGVKVDDSEARLRVIFLYTHTDAKVMSGRENLRHAAMKVAIENHFRSHDKDLAFLKSRHEMGIPSVHQVRSPNGYIESPVVYPQNWTRYAAGSAGDTEREAVIDRAITSMAFGPEDSYMQADPHDPYRERMRATPGRILEHIIPALEKPKDGTQTRLPYLAALRADPLREFLTKNHVTYRVIHRHPRERNIKFLAFEITPQDLLDDSIPTVEEESAPVTQTQDKAPAPPSPQSTAPAGREETEIKSYDDKDLEKLAEEGRKKLPQMISRGIVLRWVSARPGRKYVSDHQLPEVSRNELDIPKFREGTRQSLVAAFGNSDFAKAGVAMVFDYYDKNDDLIMSITIDGPEPGPEPTPAPPPVVRKEPAARAATGTAAVPAGATVSREFGFIAAFPGRKLETLSSKTAIGPMSQFGSVDEKEGFIYQISALRAKANEGPGMMDEETQKRLLKLNFGGFVKEAGALDVRSQWIKGSAWPVLEVSCRHVGLIAEDAISYRKAYFFLHGPTYFTVGVQGTRDNEALANEARRFFASFMIADEAMLEAAEER